MARTLILAVHSWAMLLNLSVPFFCTYKMKYLFHTGLVKTKSVFSMSNTALNMY